MPALQKRNLSSAFSEAGTEKPQQQKEDFFL